jgi:putative redox protein
MIHKPHKIGDNMVAINIKYQGDMHCQAVHGPSGTTLETDAPADNLGKAESFSPTDLVATALGTCILTVMGIKSQSMNVDITGSTASVEKEMATGPRRIGKLTVTVRVPHKLPDHQIQQLERAAFTCPVHKSMSPQVEMPIDFVWGMAMSDL